MGISPPKALSSALTTGSSAIDRFIPGMRVLSAVGRATVGGQELHSDIINAIHLSSGIVVGTAEFYALVGMLGMITTVPRANVSAGARHAVQAGEEVGGPDARGAARGEPWPRAEHPEGDGVAVFGDGERNAGSGGRDIGEELSAGGGS